MLESEVPMGADSLYYIRDYSGNYYRINNVNELVAVRNETDATVFNYDQAEKSYWNRKEIGILSCYSNRNGRWK